MACSLVALIFMSILTNGPDITLAEVHEVNNASDDGNQLDSSIEPLNIQIESTKTEDETGRKIRSAAKEVVDETMTINDGFKVADRDYDQDLVIPQRQLWSQRSLILGESPKKQSGSITQGKESVAEPAMPYIEKPFLEYRRKSSSHSDFISSKEREDNVGSEKAVVQSNSSLQDGSSPTKENNESFEYESIQSSMYYDDEFNQSPAPGTTTTQAVSKPEQVTTTGPLETGTRPERNLVPDCQCMENTIIEEEFFQVINSADCQKRCQDSCCCQFFIYDEGVTSCGLRNWPPGGRSFSIGRLSGLRDEEGWTKIPNSAYVGKVLSTSSCQDCHSACVADNNCQTVVFNQMLTECSLNYGRGPFLETKLHDRYACMGISSAYKTCQGLNRTTLVTVNMDLSEKVPTEILDEVKDQEDLINANTTSPKEELLL